MALALPAVITEAFKKLTTIKIVVNSPETRAAVNAHWGNATAWLKQNKAATDKLKQPFKDEIKKIDDANKPMIDQVKGIEAECEGAILKWDREERARIAAANTKKVEKFEVKSAQNEANAAANGTPVKHTPLPRLEQEPPKTVVVGDLKTTTVKRKDWWLKGLLKPTDKYGNFAGDPAKQFGGMTMQQNLDKPEEQHIPAEYFTLDTAKVGKVIRAGGTIPGIEVVEVESLSGRAV